MKCVIQRVKRADIVTEGVFSGEIGPGLLVLAAYCDSDDLKTIDFCVDKISNLRIFEDENGKMNKSVLDIGGNIMFVSNFTLYGNTDKGRRPSFDKSAKPAISQPLYNESVGKLAKIFPNMVTGTFGADMQINLVNDGPVTVVVEKENV